MKFNREGIVSKRNPEPIKLRPLEVQPRPGEDPNRMIKRFMKKVRNEGILQEVFLRRHFEKPSQKKRRKRAQNKFLRMVEERAAEKK